MTIYLHNKLGKQKSNFSVDQLSQALELTASDETSTEEQKILEGRATVGWSNFGLLRNQMSYFKMCKRIVNPTDPH